MLTPLDPQQTPGALPPTQSPGPTAPLPPAPAPFPTTTPVVPKPPQPPPPTPPAPAPSPTPTNPWQSNSPHGPPAGQLPNSGTWKWDPATGLYQWVSLDVDPNGQKNNPSGNTPVTPGGGPPIVPPPPDWSGTTYGGDPPWQPPTWQDPNGGWNVGSTIGSPWNTTIGQGMQGLNLAVPGAAEAYWQQMGGGYGSVNQPTNQFYQMMLSKYGNGIMPQSIGGLPGQWGQNPQAPGAFGSYHGPQYGNLSPFGPQGSMGPGPSSSYGADPNLGPGPGGYGQGPTLEKQQYDPFGPNTQMTGPTGQFANQPGIGYQPALDPFSSQYNPGKQTKDTFFQNRPGDLTTNDQFNVTNTAPANMESYYANAERQAAEGINSQMAARGAYGSSAAGNLIAEQFGNLAAQRAKEEANYGLQRSADARQWEQARTGFGLDQFKANLEGRSNALGWEQAASQYGLGQSQDELARSQNALSWNQAKGQYGLGLSEDALARNQSALSWEQASKNYEMDVAKYGVEVANQNLQYNQAKSQYGLGVGQQKVSEYNALGQQQQNAGQYALGAANYGLGAYTAQGQQEQNKANYGLHLSEDQINRYNADLAYKQAAGQYGLGAANYGLGASGQMLDYQQAAATYGVNSYQAQLAAKQAQMNYGLQVSDDAIARNQQALNWSAQNISAMGMLGGLANQASTGNLNALNSGMNAAQIAQAAQAARGQNAFNNALGYGDKTSSTMGNAYSGMFDNDTAMFNAMQQMQAGMGAEQFNQALLKAGMTRQQVDDFMRRMGDMTKAATPIVNAGVGAITGSGGAGTTAPPTQTPPIIPPPPTGFGSGGSVTLNSAAPAPPGYVSATSTRDGTTYYF